MKAEENRLHCRNCSAFPQSIFRNLPVRLLDDLALNKRHAHFLPEEVLIAAGTPHVNVICLQSGCVGVCGEPDRERSFLYTGAPGDAFGIRDLHLPGSLNSRTVTGIREGCYCLIPTEYLRGLCTSEPSLMMAVLSHLSKRISLLTPPSEDPQG